MTTRAIYQSGTAGEPACLDLIGDAAGDLTHWDWMWGHYAFASTGGGRLVRKLLSRLPGWANLEKQWLVSFDRGITTPQAVTLLAGMPDSAVRVAHLDQILNVGLQPATPFHPKTIVLGSGESANPDRLAIVAGSGNLTYFGLLKGIEVGTLTRVNEPAEWTDFLAGMQRHWDDARSPDATDLSRYESLRMGTPMAGLLTDDEALVEDDLVAGGDAARIASLRAHEHLWVDLSAGVNDNRGADRPGNQTFIKAGTRAFFGLTSAPVARKTPLGSITIHCAGNSFDRTVHHGHNGQDLINLPNPEEVGVETYKGRAILFTKRADGGFDLEIHELSAVGPWSGQGEQFTMQGGRAYGVF